MNRKLSAAAVALALTAAFSLGALSDDAIDTISAQLRRDVTISIDGEAVVFADDAQNQLYPISYDGVTYLPANAITAALNAELTWDEAQTAMTITTTIDAPRGSGMTYARVKELQNVAVFWAPTGNKMHSNPDCRTFKDGISYAGTLEQAQIVRTGGWCGICGGFEGINEYATDFRIESCYTFEDYEAGLPKVEILSLFTQFENGLIVAEIDYTSTEMAAYLIGAVDGMKYTTTDGTIEIYYFDVSSESYAAIKDSGKVTLQGFGSFPAYINGDMVMLKNDYTATDTIQAIFKSLK